jgi:hypothetical protein
LIGFGTHQFFEMVLPMSNRKSLHPAPAERSKKKSRHVIVRLFNLLPWLVCGVVFLIFIHSLEDENRYEHRSHASLLDIEPRVKRNQGVNHLNQTKVVQVVHAWEDSISMPKWMVEFFTWQTQQRKGLNPTNWMNYHYLVLRCYKEDPKCGGLSDRLKPIPLMVLAAAKSRRLLFLDWTRPYPLTEFLSPASNGLDWTLPDWLRENLLGQSISRKRQTVTSAAKLIDSAMTDQYVAIFSHLHDTWGGSHQYDEEEGYDAFGKVFHDVFHILFEPSPPIKQIVDATMHKNSLKPGEYVTAHYRAEYGKEVARHPKLRDPNFLAEMALNSINCASSLCPGAPIFFASDSRVALDAVRGFQKVTKHPIVFFEREEDTPLHLDTLSNETHPTVPSDYYSTFVDLFLAGNGKCSAYGKGGYGRFLSLMSYNASCSKKHTKNFFPDPCKWSN